MKAISYLDDATHTCSPVFVSNPPRSIWIFWQDMAFELLCEERTVHILISKIPKFKQIYQGVGLQKFEKPRTSHYLKGSMGTELICSHRVSFQATNLLPGVHLHEIGSTNGSEERETRGNKHWSFRAPNITNKNKQYRTHYNSPLLVKYFTITGP